MRLQWLQPGDPPDAFPPVAHALSDPPGLLVAGGDLSVGRVLAAYRRGIFPWYIEGEPILWWSPDPREVLPPAAFHRSRSLQRRMRSGEYRVTRDAAFGRVIEACASARAEATGTWITPEMRAAYKVLHAMGHAHSVETWLGDELVGGLYGVRVGTVFSGESMFSRRPDASKVALAWLVDHCAEDGVQLIDCQTPSAHLRSLGSRAMPRAQFLEVLGTPVAH